MNRRDMMQTVLASAASLALAPSLVAAMPESAGRLETVFDAACGPGGSGFRTNTAETHLQARAVSAGLSAILRLRAQLEGAEASGRDVPAWLADAGWRAVASASPGPDASAAIPLVELHQLVCGLLVPESVPIAAQWRISEATRLAVLTAFTRESTPSGRAWPGVPAFSIADGSGAEVAFVRLDDGRCSMLVTIG